MTQPLMLTSVQTDNQTLLSWPLSPADMTAVWFDPAYWQQQKKIYAQKQGRATTWFFQHQACKGVLRHYWRGGLIGKLIKDQYFYTGLKNTRVYKEFALLVAMHQKGLNVPLPVGARVIKRGLVYRGDIITGAIPGAQSLLDVLKVRRLSGDEITRVAQTLAGFHRHGVYHADLNINNILFSAEGEVFLIDFDRGEFRQPVAVWQRQNIARLLRSFNKEAGRNQAFYWQDQDWQQLLASYDSQMQQRASVG